MPINTQEKAVSNPVPDDFDYIEDCAHKIAEYAKNGIAYSGCFDGNEINEVVEKLKENGFRPTQRPHCKLPALMVHWDNLLKESGYPVMWFSKRIKGRRTVVRAVAGALFTNNGKILEHYIRLFSDSETEDYERDHSYNNGKILEYYIRLFSDSETEDYERNHS